MTDTSQLKETIRDSFKIGTTLINLNRNLYILANFQIV